MPILIEGKVSIPNTGTGIPPGIKPIVPLDVGLVSQSTIPQAAQQKDSSPRTPRACVKYPFKGLFHFEL